MSELRIGCSGWVYKDWTGPFYPEGTKDRERLEYYATRFDTAEINASFYRLPSEAMVEGWARRAPPAFVFAWKVSRFITHNKKLKDCGESVDLVFGRMAPLGDKLGPALIQLPPQLRRNDDRLAGFLKLLPPGRRTVEFRHPSWYEPAVFRILSDFDAALCISDHHHAPAPWELTASWAYVRGHGPGGRYFGRYSDEEMQAWADRIGAWRAQGLDVYAYFDNDIKSAAPFDALTLKRLTA
ncbi:DUF72 domain-containing protein [Phenylobacterium sp.]|uniref:DUF72 domain-containing protein n=1 Tax=Phenylobacterium sp. TaxID=1871053 RepID=UPI0028116420|nr:DUF72 domain-containing protein [Phenylobacterium sp.]